MAIELSKLAAALLFLGLSLPDMSQTGPRTALSQGQNPVPFLEERKIAIVVGISDYPPESGFPKLRFAAKDAQDLAAVLGNQGYKVHLLIDERAMRSSIRLTLQQVRDELNEVRNSDKPSGTVLFAFSGHGGETNVGGKAHQFMVTYDATADDPAPGYLLKDIGDALNSARAARVMMFIDACRDLTGISSKGKPPLSSFSQQLMRAQGVKTLFSTAAGQRSYEDDQAHNGYFTRYLLEGLKGKAATPDGLVTFDSLAKWVSQALHSEPSIDQVPYWNQDASGDFYVAGRMVNKDALVVGVDRYGDRTLHSAISGARQVERQLYNAGFDTAFVTEPGIAELRERLGGFARKLAPDEVAVFYFAGEGGIASGAPFLMTAGAKLPDTAIEGKWRTPPQDAISLAEVMDIVRRNHPGPDIFFLDMGLSRAGPSDTLDLASLRREHTLVLFSCKSGQDPKRTDEGTLFSRTVASVLAEPDMTAGYAASKIATTIFSQTNGAEYAVEIPMLPDRVYLTPQQ